MERVYVSSGLKPSSRNWAASRSARCRSCSPVVVPVGELTCLLGALLLLFGALPFLFGPLPFLFGQAFICLLGALPCLLGAFGAGRDDAAFAIAPAQPLVFGVLELTMPERQAQIQDRQPLRRARHIALVPQHEDP